jgi:hypothetical protein
MRTRRLVASAAAALGLALALAVPSIASADNPKIIGSYSADFTWTSGCPGCVSHFDWQITNEDVSSGKLSGTSSSSYGSGQRQLTGTISGTSINLYDGPWASYWYFSSTGTLASDCSMSGTWSDEGNSSGTWRAKQTSGQCAGVGNCVPVDDRAHGLRIESIGDALNARNVAIVVPGVANNYGTFPTLRAYATHVAGEIGRLYARGRAGQSAVIAWLGYNPPDGATLAEAAGSFNAEIGAENLVAFIRCLRANSHVPHFTLTAIGHSYGSVVVGRAAQMGGLDGDNVVFVGSPGVDAANVRALGHPTGVYAGENPNDFIQFTTSIVTRALSESLSTTPTAVCHAVGKQLGRLYVVAFHLCDLATPQGHGPDPTSAGFGARRFSTAGECGHQYFDDAAKHGTEGLANLARIVMGDGRRITPERRAPIAPFALRLATVIGIPVINGISINWTVTCKRSSQATAGTKAVSVTNYDATHDVINAAMSPLQLIAGSFRPRAFGRAAEAVTMTLFARKATTKAAAAATRRRVIVIANGNRTLKHAGRAIVRLHLTGAGRRYLGPQRGKVVQLILGVRVRRHGHLGYFAGAVTARI